MTLSIFHTITTTAIIQIMIAIDNFDCNFRQKIDEQKDALDTKYDFMNISY